MKEEKYVSAFVCITLTSYFRYQSDAVNSSFRAGICTSVEVATWVTRCCRPAKVLIDTQSLKSEFMRLRRTRIVNNRNMPLFAKSKIGTFRGTCVYCAILIGIIWCILEPFMYNEMDIFWARTEYHFEYCIWQQMLTEMFAFWFITQSLLKTKQMAKSTLKVKINSKSWEAIKMIGPCTSTRCKQNLRSGFCFQFIWFHVSHGFLSRQ